MTHIRKQYVIATFLVCIMLMTAGCGGMAGDTGSGNGNPVASSDDEPDNTTNATTPTQNGSQSTSPTNESTTTSSSQPSQNDAQESQSTSDTADSQSDSNSNADSNSDSGSNVNVTVNTENNANADANADSDANSKSGSTSASSSDSDSSSQSQSSSDSDSSADDGSSGENNADSDTSSDSESKSSTGGTVTLTFEDQDGDPLPQGTVGITLPGQDVEPRQLSIDDNGQVTFEAEYDENYYYKVDAPGVHPDNANGQINVNGDTQETIQVAETTYTLTVQADSAVTIERGFDGAMTTREPTDGTAEFTVLPGEYIATSDNLDNETQSKSVDVQSDTKVILDTLQPEEPEQPEQPQEPEQPQQPEEPSTSEVTMTVEDPNVGGPIEATITLTGPDGETYSKQTGGDGEVTFTLPTGEYERQITITEDGEYEMANAGYAETIQVGGGPETFDYMFFSPPEEIEANMRVVNAETGEPIEGAQIQGMSPSMANPYKPDFSVETGPNGYYNGTILSAESYDYSVTADGYETIGGSAEDYQVADRTFKLQPTNQTATM